MKIIEITIPDEIISLLGSEEEARKEAKEALILDLVRRGKVSKAKAAELIGISLWDLPEFLDKYRIPWFDCTEEDLQKDLDTSKELESLERTAD
jgi:predicted HTH domain antitoxin